MFQRKGKHSQNDIYNIRIHRDIQRHTERERERLGEYIKVMVQSWATNKKKNLVALRACNYQSTGLRTTQTTTMTNKQRSTVVVSFFCIYFFFISLSRMAFFLFLQQNFSQPTLSQAIITHTISPMLKNPHTKPFFCCCYCCYPFRVLFLYFWRVRLNAKAQSSAFKVFSPFFFISFFFFIFFLPFRRSFEYFVELKSHTT